mgnify:CR=1 FL=1
MFHLHFIMSLHFEMSCLLKWLRNHGLTIYKRCEGAFGSAITKSFKLFHLYFRLDVVLRWLLSMFMYLLVSLARASFQGLVKKRSLPCCFLFCRLIMFWGGIINLKLNCLVPVIKVNLCLNCPYYFYNSSLDILVGFVTSWLFKPLYRYNAHFILII